MPSKVKSEDRLAALEKALLLSKLFEPTSFQKATEALNNMGDVEKGKKDFLDVCSAKQIKNAEWLWKALKTAQKEQSPDGAKTGW